MSAALGRGRDEHDRHTAKRVRYLVGEALDVADELELILVRGRALELGDGTVVQRYHPAGRACLIVTTSGSRRRYAVAGGREK